MNEPVTWAQFSWAAGIAVLVLGAVFGFVFRQVSTLRASLIGHKLYAAEHYVRQNALKEMERRITAHMDVKFEALERRLDKVER